MHAACICTARVREGIIPDAGCFCISLPDIDMPMHGSAAINCTPSLTDLRDSLP